MSIESRTRPYPHKDASDLFAENTKSNGPSVVLYITLLLSALLIVYKVNM